ncbi:polysaccharide deacetylase family protein [Cytophagaceae bacterium ABcell3]|nr:polysaccharide deacetylase family protein [Cytophagaceae bacterium ABcell3]
MLSIYVEEINPRIEYIFSFILKDLLKLQFELTDQESTFREHKGAKMSYSFTAPENSPLHFTATKLLFEDKINDQPIQIFNKGSENIIFPVNSGIFPFDPFAASFYLVTRYEEYLPHKKDKHKRYIPEQSIAYKGGFLEKPIVDIWASRIKETLLNLYPKLPFGEKQFSFCPTLDIDHAYAYRGKGLVRTAGALAIRLAKLKFRKFFNRLSVLLHLKQDPYDSYQKQADLHEKYKLKPIYFILIGDYGKFDPNSHHKNPIFQKLIKHLQGNYPIGLHPSYRSNSKRSRLTKERKRLESILNEKVHKSRQHFIKLTIPNTYRDLVKEGITEDYSMGYPSRSGFRASTSNPFYFFDLEKNKTTKLRVQPFVIMDTTLKIHLKIRAKDVGHHVRPLVNEVKAVNGHFSYIFHNESIGGKRQWKNWGGVYEKIIKICQEN